MNIILYYLMTLIITFGVREANILLMIRDLGDTLCKLDDDVIKGNPNVTLFNLQDINIKHFIPLYNVYKSVSEIIKYEKDPFAVLEELDNNDLIAEMFYIEKMEYLKDPSFISLLKNLNRNHKRILNAYYLQTLDDDKKVNGEVFYDYDDNGEIVILNTYGEIEKMLNSEIIELIKNKGMKALPKKTLPEKIKEKSKIMIRSINFDLLKRKVFSLVKRTDDVNIKPIVITVNEQETGISQIIIRELADYNFEVLDISGGITELSQDEMINCADNIIRSYMYSKYYIEVGKIEGLEKQKVLHKTK